MTHAILNYIVGGSLGRLSFHATCLRGGGERESMPWVQLQEIVIPAKAGSGNLSQERLEDRGEAVRNEKEDC